ncbi:MAG: hypothetical protein PSX36_13140 [bacterium]|nr:hypothetical protein [bacterium]
MAKAFLTYRKFQNSDQASELVELLNQNGIPFEIEDSSGSVSDFIIGQDVHANFAVKIDPDHFLKVDELSDALAASLIDTIGKDHYLYEFENDELIEVLSEPDKWCEVDKQLAKKILVGRGITVSKELEEALHKKRLKDLSAEVEGSSVWTTLGYISAFLGGLLGIAIGLNLWISKRTLPNGTKTYVYTERDRKHGQVITILGIVMLCFGIYFQIRFNFF